MKYKIIGKYIKNLDFKIPNPKIFSLLSKNISNYKINIDIKKESRYLVALSPDLKKVFSTQSIFSCFDNLEKPSFINQK